MPIESRRFKFEFRTSINFDDVLVRRTIGILTFLNGFAVSTESQFTVGNITSIGVSFQGDIQNLNYLITNIQNKFRDCLITELVASQIDLKSIPILLVAECNN